MIKLYDIFYNLLIAMSTNKITPPYSCRISFLLGSVMYNSNQYFNTNFQLVDNFPKSNISIDIKNKEEYIISISMYTLNLINDTYLKNDILKKYIDENNQYILNNDIMSQIKILIDEYLDYRFNDGWNVVFDNSNLYNKEIRIKLNEIQNINSFPYPLKWTPIDGQNALGGTFGNIISPILINSNIFNYSINYYNNINIESEVQYLFNKSLILNQTEKSIAEIFNGYIINPPMMWLLFMIHLYRNKETYSLDENIYGFFLLTISLFTVSIVVWNVKYNICEARPIQLIRTINNIPINYYSGSTVSDLWLSYLKTPPFPDIMSGHSTFSSNMSFLFNKLFGENIDDKLIIDKDIAILISPIFKYSNEKYIDFSKILLPKDTILLDNSLLTEDITLEYKTWCDMAYGISLSRFYGGIHYYSSNQLGIIVGKLINEDICEIIKPF
jgi:hypothetical protein